MPKLRIALCGCLGHVEKFGRLINSYEESEVVAVWDYDRGRASPVAEALSVPLETDYDALLRSYALDGVVIVAENRLHKELVIKAAEAGVSVFVEKPLCVDPKDAQEIRDVIRKTGVKFYMTDPFVRSGQLYVKQLIRDGRPGTVTGARMRLGVDSALHRRSGYPDYNKENSLGGIMADVGGHMIHIAHFLFGKPDRLSAMLSCHTEAAKQNGIEENAVVVMGYPDGKLVTLECSWVAGGDSSSTEVFGTLGWARITKRGPEEGDDLVTVQIGHEAAEEVFGAALPENPKRHVRYFIEMLANDLPNDIVGEDPLSNSGVSISSAVEFTEIIDAVYRSASGGAVTL